MRGGASSLLYPLAIGAEARGYIIRSVGGTSMGAIAATMTAAAELGRTAAPVGADALANLAQAGQPLAEWVSGMPPGIDERFIGREQ